VAGGLLLARASMSLIYARSHRAKLAQWRPKSSSPGWPPRWPPRWLTPPPGQVA